MIENKEIRLISERIVSKIHPRNIILFGSYATNTEHEESDIDLCVIVNTKKRKIDIIREIRRELIGLVKHPIDILVYEYREFNERANSLNSIEKEILRSGVYLYG